MLVNEQAHAKINLALHVMGRRADGYHELDSIVAFADVADVLTIAPADSVSLDITGPFAGDLPRDGTNTVLSAWRLLDGFSRQQGAGLAPVKFRLEKNLPVASGIGGGSADAAAALRGLIRLFEISVSEPDLSELALQLGADVPVCLLQKSSRMRGVGEIIEPIEIDLPEGIVLVNPRIPASTSKVFDSLNLECGQSFGAAIGSVHDIESWRNDLTAPAISLVPEITEVIGNLIFQPDIACSRMSGSGATCFGLFASLEKAQIAADAIAEKNPHWWVAATTLL
ncbi:MAG: 4-(cytidine 5'-diphospho)-2-C-methyl-D-erythritol kinase [Aestuariivirga sp.]